MILEKNNVLNSVSVIVSVIRETILNKFESLNRDLFTWIRKHTKLAVFTTALLILILGCFLVFRPSKDANASADHETYKCYTSITIAPGDTLWSIADEYRTLEYKDNQEYINEVKKINHISDDTSLYAGCRLVVPYYTDAVEE